MNYNDIRKLSEPNEPSNDELREIEEHLDDYFEEDWNYVIIIFTISNISNTFNVKSAFKSDWCLCKSDRLLISNISLATSTISKTSIVWSEFISPAG